MGKKYISAAVQAAASSVGNLSINSDTILGALSYGEQTPDSPMPIGANAAGLFEAINALLSSSTKYTTINFYFQYNRGISGTSWLEQRELTINIVWSQSGAPGEISYGGFGTGKTHGHGAHGATSRQGSVAGNMHFKELTGDTNINLYRIFPYASSAYSPGKAFEISLNLTPGLPAINSLPFWGGGYSVSYTIETDDGIIISANNSTSVSGVKISELTTATSLNDTDLFVLSRDDPAGAPYDDSKNVTLENLKADILAAGSLASRTVRGYVEGDFIGSAGLGAPTVTSIDSATLGAQTYKVLAGFNAWLTANSADVTIELQYELNESGTWVQFANLKTKKLRTGASGHGYVWTVSPMGLADFVAPSAGSYKFRMVANDPALLIHDFSVILL